MEKEREETTGRLILCATPIGNLEDVSFRVIKTLKEADLIAAEDTRNSIKLLNHFEIHTPMTSYHEYNKVEKGKELVEKMKAGQTIALITDAGTPGISDPGEVVCRLCHEAGIPVTAVPGPAACIMALIISGLPTRRFSFEAFLPAEKSRRNQVLDEMALDMRTMVVYEAPHHLKKTVKDLFAALGDRRIVLCRELTKKHEEVREYRLKELAETIETYEPRGEYVLVIEGKSYEEKEKEQQQAFESLSILDHMEQFLQKGMDRKEAMKQVAKERGLSKREVYQQLLTIEQERKEETT